MSLYDDASLIMYPSGYKEDKIYSLKPTDGAGDLTFTRASTATRVNSAGLVEEVATGVPRIDYTGGGCGKLLLEPQRTNLATYSEQFDNAAWAKSGATVTANDIISPDGTLNADKLENSTDGARYISQNISLTSGTSYTYSFFVKKGIMDWCYLLAIGSTNTAASTFDILNGVVGSSASSNISITNKIENYGNGWYRCSITFTPTVSTSFNFRIYNADSATDVNTVAGSYNYIYGAQLEASSYQTSYIPTLASSVTRIQDTCFKTGISSLIGQTEGTLFVDITTTDDITTVTPIGLNDGTGSNRILLYVSAGTLNALVSISGIAQALISSSSILPNTRYKMAIAYKANDFAFYVNGVQIGIDTNGGVPALSKFSYDNGSGTASFYGLNNQALLFKTRLTNTQLAQLTTI